MTKDEFFDAVDALMEALVDAGFTDASPGASYPSEDEAVAEINGILPDEVVKLTELINGILPDEVVKLTELIRKGRAL